MATGKENIYTYIENSNCYTTKVVLISELKLKNIHRPSYNMKPINIKYSCIQRTYSNHIQNGKHPSNFWSQQHGHLQLSGGKVSSIMM
jgi:hypothetical protein